MSEPYSPNYLDSLGIEYIKEESIELGNIYRSDLSDIAKKRNSLKKKQAMLKVLQYQIKKRESKNKTRKRLFM